VLNRLFQNALEAGKRVRTLTDLGARPMSVAFAGVKLAEQVFGKLHDQQAVVVGAGTVAEQVADHLRDRGIGKLCVVNRSRERGELLARQVKGEYREWLDLERVLEQSDIAVTSVAAAEPVIDAARMGRVMRSRGNRDAFLIDLGVPRNVAPEVGRLYNVFLYNVNDLTAIVEENRAARQQEIPRAEAIVDEQVGKFQMWLTSLEVVALARQLREKVQHEREVILRERVGRIGHLSAEERQRAVHLMAALIDRILQEPAVEGRDPHVVLHHNAGELQKLLRLVEEPP
jgi:glutamyl-tRNA reductase